MDRTVPLDPLPLSKEHKRRLRQLDELLAWAEGQLTNWPFPDDLLAVVVAQQAGGIHRLARAVLAQIRGGSTDFLESRMRAMVEASINVRYILAADSQARARAFAIDDVKSRRTMVNRTAPLMRRGKAESMASISTQETWDEIQSDLDKELADLEAKYGKVTVGWPSIEQRAQKGDSEELYATAFWWFSQDEHLTTRGLDKYMKTEDGKLYFDFGHDLTLLYSFISMAIVYYVSLLNEVSKLTGHPNPSELERFDRVATEITTELRPPSGSATGSVGSGGAESRGVSGRALSS